MYGKLKDSLVKELVEIKAAGLYKKESNDLVEIGDCPIQNENVNRVIEQVLEICDKNDIRAFDPITMRGLLRYVVVRASNYSDEIQGSSIRLMPDSVHNSELRLYVGDRLHIIKKSYLRNLCPLV